jgi:hypothetical protein
MAIPSQALRGTSREGVETRRAAPKLRNFRRRVDEKTRILRLASVQRNVLREVQFRRAMFDLISTGR